MKKIIWALLFLAITASGFTQQLSNDIFPSEDELLEALNLGEIDNEQYQILQEIFSEGINENNIHLLDEIPYLRKFFIKSLKDYSSYQKEQLEYISSNPLRGTRQGSLTYKYYQKFNEPEDARYRIKSSYRFNKSWQFDLRLQKEYSANERIVQRTLYYKDTNQFINYLFLGNYSKKVGLGTIFGYRGKLLDFSNSIDDESILFPDYGGKNGLLLNFGKNNINTTIFTNVIRDETHLFRTVGGSIKYESQSLTLQPILSVTRLLNRNSSNFLDDFKAGINISKKYKENKNEIEFSFQNGIHESFAVITEGEFNFKRSLRVTYSFWSYADKYLDFESGSTSGSLNRKNALDEIEYNLSSRRSGQRGGLINFNTNFSDEFQFYNTILYSKINNDSLLVEYSPALLKKHSAHVLLKLDYIYKFKEYNSVVAKNRRVRGEIYYTNNNLKIRNNISYTRKSGNPNYVGWFFQLRWKNRNSEYEIWSNLSKIDFVHLKNDYWYSYVQHKYKIARSIFGVTKISHSYSRNSSTKHSTTISTEFRVAL